MSEIHHGSHERVSWSVVVYDDLSPHPSASHALFGENEDAARADFAHRSRCMHRGKTIRLERTVRVDSWIQSTEPIEVVTKPKPEEPCATCGGRGWVEVGSSEWNEWRRADDVDGEPCPTCTPDPPAVDPATDPWADTIKKVQR